MRELGAHRGELGPDQRHLQQVVDGEQPRGQPVVHVVVVVGDVVRDRGHLGLGRGVGGELQVAVARELGHR